MIEPLACVSRIIRDDPGLAEPLLDLLLWSSGGGARESAEYDQIEELLYSKTRDSSGHRAEYTEERQRGNSKVETISNLAA